jgi:hypothetical protein
MAPTSTRGRSRRRSRLTLVGSIASADTGSVDAARQAGAAHASSVDRSTTPAMVLHAAESAGLVLNSSDSSHRVPSAATVQALCPADVPLTTDGA